MAESKEKFILTLSLNKEQKEEIEKFLKEKNWTGVITASAKEARPQKPKKRKSAQLCSMSTPRDECVLEFCENSDNIRNLAASCSSISNTSVQVLFKIQTIIQVRRALMKEKDDVHTVLFHRVLQTQIEQLGGLGMVKRENIENSTIRKRIYKRFWKIMANNGAWTIPEYIAKKIRIGGGDWVLTHQRELMHECVVSLARQLYPNPKTIPYMNHMWE